LKPPDRVESGWSWEDVGIPSARLQCVTVELSHGVLEVGQAPRITLPVIDDGAALREGLPGRAVAHHGELANDLLIVEEMVLPQHAHPGAAGQRDGAVAGWLVARHDTNERRLARAVGAHQPVAAARVQLQRDAFEQRARAEGLGQILNAEHAGPRLASEPRDASENARRPPLREPERSGQARCRTAR
jgi:hypothetical protein